MANGFTLPPQFQADQQSIDRRRQMAQALVQQALTPQQGQMAGRIYVPPGPLSAISRVAQAYFGGQGLKSADEEEKQLGGRYQSALADEVKRIAALRQGQPATTDAADNIQDPGVPGDPRAAITQALTSQFPAVRTMGELDFKANLQERENKAARLARLEERAMQLEAQSAEKALDRESKERIAKETNDVRLEIAQLRSEMNQLGRSPYFTPVYTPQGILSFNNRQGTAEPLLVGGKSVVRSQDDPSLQGRIAGAKTAGEAQAKREFNMSGIGATIDRAEKILGGTNPETGAAQALPTGSGLGSLVDKGAGFLGFSPRGAAEATELKAIAGALTSKMPRMEGSQSDRDTLLYREMAAQVGDDTIPVEQRVRALESVKALWRKYEKQNPDAFTGGDGGGLEKAPEGVPPDVWNAMTPEERALWGN